MTNEYGKSEYLQSIKRQMEGVEELNVQKDEDRAQVDESFDAFQKSIMAQRLDEKRGKDEFSKQIQS